MILPFLRKVLDENGLFHGKLPEEYDREVVVRLIDWVKQDSPDTEEMKERISEEQLSIPEEYQPYFQNYDSCYAFLQLARLESESSSYYFPWRKHCTPEQKEWVESWFVFNDDGQLNLVESAKKLRADEDRGHQAEKGEDIRKEVQSMFDYFGYSTIEMEIYAAAYSILGGTAEEIVQKVGEDSPRVYFYLTKLIRDGFLIEAYRDKTRIYIPITIRKLSVRMGGLVI